MQAGKIIVSALKIILCAFLLTTLIAAAVALFAWTYGTPVPHDRFIDLKITSSTSGSLTNVSIDGGLKSSSLAVYSVRQHRKKHCIIVVVREGLARDGRRAGDFHLEIAVPDDVDEIAFENSRDVIWHR
jgi:hypothetical protein